MNIPGGQFVGTRRAVALELGKLWHKARGKKVVIPKEFRHVGQRSTACAMRACGLRNKEVELVKSSGLSWKWKRADGYR